MPGTSYLKLLIPVCLLFIAGLAQAQVKYITASDYLQARTIHQAAFQDQPLDTSISNFQNYYPRNTNGHFGVPSAPLVFGYSKQPLGFRLYELPYANDIISDDQVLFYRSKGPYASLTGIAGSRQEQWFRLLFSHTFKNSLNLTVAFNRYSGLGFYNKQQSFTNNFYTSSNYASSNGRWGYNAYFLYNKVKHQENGGIKDDSLFINNPRVTKTLLPVNISSARRENRTLSVYANPWFRLNKREDSSTVLSHYVDYVFRYQANYYKYRDDNDSGDHFYQLYYLDPAATKDSTHTLQFINQANYTLKVNPLDLALKIGYRNEYNLVHQYNDSVIRNNLVLANLSVSKKQYQGNLSASSVVSGGNQGDYQAELANRLALPLFKKMKSPVVFSLNVLAEQRHADYIYNKWYSNHFVWSNQYSPVQTQQASASLSSKDLRLSLGAFVQNINHFLYFDNQARPQQYDGNVQKLSVYIKKELLIARHLGFDNTVYYQSTSDSNLVRMPKLDIRSALYYQGNLFNKALWLQVGFQGEYYSRFTSYAYMPATNIYYLQNNQRAGNYPYIDFFLSARIKPVKFFVKIDHVFQGFLGTNYSLLAGYLQPDRAFKFGLNWVFFD